MPPPSPAMPLGIIIVDSEEAFKYEERDTRLWMGDSEHNPKQMREWPIIAFKIGINGIEISEKDQEILKGLSGKAINMYVNAHGVASGSGATQFGSNTFPQDTSKLDGSETYTPISAQTVIAVLSQHLKEVPQLDCKMLCCKAAAATGRVGEKNLQERFFESAAKIWKLTSGLSVTAHKPIVFLARSGTKTKSRLSAPRVCFKDNKGEIHGVLPGTSIIGYLHQGKMIKFDLHAQSCPQAIANFSYHIQGKLFKITDKTTRRKLQKVLKAPHHTVIELADALCQVASHSHCKYTAVITAQAKSLALLKGREQQSTLQEPKKENAKKAVTFLKFADHSTQSTSTVCKEHADYLKEVYAQDGFLRERIHWIDETLSHRKWFKHIAFQCTSFGSDPAITTLLKGYRLALVEIAREGGDIAQGLLRLDAKLLQEMQKFDPKNKIAKQLTMEIELEELPEEERKSFLENLAKGAPELGMGAKSTKTANTQAEESLQNKGPGLKMK